MRVFERGSRAGFGKFGQYLITANTTAAYTLDPFRETQSMTPGLRDDLRLGTEDPIMEAIRALPTYELLDELSSVTFNTFSLDEMLAILLDFVSRP